MEVSLETIGALAGKIEAAKLLKLPAEEFLTVLDNKVLSNEALLEVDNKTAEQAEVTLEPFENSNEDNDDCDNLLSTIRITTVADEYTTCTGSYRAWSTDMNLGPYSQDIPVPDEDENVGNYYEALQYTLYETGCPETIDRTNKPKTVLKDTVSITILSSPVECMTILMEGGRQCPGDMLLVLSTSWLSKKKSETKEGFYSLYVHKAIAFGATGDTFLETYDPPRKTTYLVNFFTSACTNGQRNDGAEIEADLDCPTSSSLKLTQLVDDKVWTRCIMAKVGMAFPETLAFVFESDIMYPQQEDICVVHIDKEKMSLNAIIHNEITKHLNRCLEKGIEKIVVKPSGVMWHGSSGVTFHYTTDQDEIIRFVQELLTFIQKGDAVLVEAFQKTIKPIKSGKVLKWACTDDLAVRLRATVCRCPEDIAITTNVNCGLASKDEPVNGDNTIAQSLKTTLTAFGITNEIEVARFEEEVRQKGAALLESIMCHENDLSTAERGGLRAQTDIIGFVFMYSGIMVKINQLRITAISPLGIDFVITRRNGVLTPVGIEVNSHDCTINCQIYENLYHLEKGTSVGPWVQTMIARSQKYVLAGKKILVIGAGGYSKAFIWPAAQDMGVKVILIEVNPNHFAAEEVSEFIHYDFSDHSNDDDHAVKIYQLLRKKNMRVDGCLTFWEDCVPLAAKMCNLLNLTGPSVRGAMNAKNKSSTLSVLRKRTADIPHFPRTYLYTSWFTSIGGRADLENATKVRKFPLIMKLEYGSSAVGVAMVKCAEELEEKYMELSSTFQKDEDYFGIGLGHGNTVMVMEYIGGTEHDVDVVIFERKLVAAFVSDNGPTRGKTFTETAACMPSCLPYDKQRQLITAAYQCCTEIGLENGVFNVEMKMISTGPKLVEINGRMGGFYLRDWIKKLYAVDMIMCAFLVSCGIRPSCPERKPKGQFMGVMCIPSLHSHMLNDPDTLSRRQELESKGIIHFNQFDEHADIGKDGFEEPFANVAVMENDVLSAKQKLLELAKEFNITDPTYNVADFLGDFKNY